MKKVGILTFHRAINYGAALQTFALNYYLNSQKIDATTIDYRCKYIEKEYKNLSFYIYNPKKSINSLINFANNINRKIKFRKFLKENIKISSKKYDKKNIYTSNDNYNIFITGSDQVWNLDLCGDDTFYLNFVSKNNDRLSYAASFGDISLIDRNKKYIKDSFSKYKRISVREESVRQKLNKELNLKATLSLDPTFLLEKQEWEKFVDNKYGNEKYILLYVLHEETSYKIAKKISEKTGLKVYVITQSRKKRIKGKYIRNAGPKDFLSLIKNCEYVITDSFHGTALSIIFQKNLKVVMKKKNMFLNDRLVSIINLLGLNKCIVDEKTTSRELIEETNYDNQ